MHQCHKFYEYESRDEQPEFYEGRWKWKARTTYDLKKPTGDYKIEWSDLYGQNEDVIFDVNLPVDTKYVFYPLNRQFGLLHSCFILDEEELVLPFYLVELDWINKTSTFVEDASISAPTDPDDEQWAVLLDRANDDENINFLLYRDHDTHQHCQLEVAGRKLKRLGDSFELPCEKFNCLDLNGDVISGLDKNLNQINRYCLSSRQFLSPIKVSGLPSTIYCICPNSISTRPDSRRRSAGLWTADRLYIWSQTDELKDCRSVIYFIQLDTGVATPINFVFDNWIRRLYLSQDGFLHVRNDKYIGRGKRDQHGNFVPFYHEAAKDYLTNYRFFRLPIRKPETLFSLAYAALARPLPPIANQLVDKHKNVPKLLSNKCI